MNSAKINNKFTIFYNKKLQFFTKLGQFVERKVISHYDI